MKKPDRRTAVVGERFNDGHRGIKTILPKPENASNNGRWHCISCDHRCYNNIDKDDHCRTVRRGTTKLVEELGTPAKHVLAWYSAETGDYEEP